MDKKRLNILIIEPSILVYEGLTQMIGKANTADQLYRINNFEELERSLVRYHIDVVIINPSYIQNRISDFKKIKNRYTDISWIGMVYSHHDKALINEFYQSISILESEEEIVKKIHARHSLENNELKKEKLTNREIEVLKLLIDGLSNKEIAHILTISSHTVISHRKRIMEKTGIKSLPGLAIFAVAQNIISVNSTVK